jgi:hypothetical protein
MTRPPKGTGLVRGSEDWDLVKSQIESGQFDISGSIPHRRILDFNIEEKNWPKERYDYAALAASVRNLVNQLRVTRVDSKLFIELLL